MNTRIKGVYILCASMRMKVEKPRCCKQMIFQRVVTGEIRILCKIFAVLCEFGLHPDYG